MYTSVHSEYTRVYTVSILVYTVGILECSLGEGTMRPQNEPGDLNVGKDDASEHVLGDELSGRGFQ